MSVQKYDDNVSTQGNTSNDHTRDERLSSLGNKIEIKESRKRFPAVVRSLVQEETKRTLFDIQQHVEQFVLFVEAVQRETPARWELITVTPLQPTHLVSNSPGTSDPDSGHRRLLSSCSRSSNVSLRDAFQIVRNLLSRIAAVIDKIAFSTSKSDDSEIEVNSPLYDFYYAQYVLQLSYFVIQLISEKLNEFGKILSAIAVNEELGKAPVVDGAQDPRLKDVKVFLAKKGEFEHEAPKQSSHRVEKKELKEPYRPEHPGKLSETELKTRIADALELMMFLSEKMLSSIGNAGMTMQEKEKNHLRAEASGICPDCRKKPDSSMHARYCGPNSPHQSSWNHQTSEKGNVLGGEENKSSSASGAFSCEAPKFSSFEYAFGQTGKDNLFQANKFSIGSQERSWYQKDEYDSFYFPNSERGSSLGSSVKSKYELIQNGFSESPKPFQQGQANGSTDSPKSSQQGHVLSGSQGAQHKQSLKPSTEASKKQEHKFGAHTSAFESFQEQKSNGNDDIQERVNFDLNKFSSLFKEEVKKYISQDSQNRSALQNDSKALLDIVCQCYREASDPKESGAQRKFEAAEPRNSLDSESSEGNVEDNDQSSEASRESEEIDQELDKFVAQSYKIVIYSMNMKKMQGKESEEKQTTLHETQYEADDTDKKYSILDEITESDGIQASSSDSSSTRPSEPAFTMTHFTEKPSQEPFKEVSPEEEATKCSEECLTGSTLHASHDKLPADIVEVRRVTDEGEVEVTLEDWNEEEEIRSRQPINCKALMDLREGLDEEDESRHKDEGQEEKSNGLASKSSKGSDTKVNEVRKNLLSKRPSLDSIPNKTRKVKQRIRDLSEDTGVDMKVFLSKFYEFGENLRKIGYCNGPPLELRVNPDSYVEEVFKTLMVSSRIPLSYYKKVRILHYTNRNDPDGEDQTEDTFTRLGRLLFRGTAEGLFDFPSLESKHVYPNPASTSHVKWFEFAGKILALSIVQVEYLGARLPLCFFKCLLDRPLSLTDLEEVDPLLHERLIWIRDSNISGKCLKFVIHERMGNLSLDTELVHNGKEVTVTEENKHDYIEKCLKWKLAERCLLQIKFIRKGFTSVLDPYLLEALTDKEIQVMVEKCPSDSHFADLMENGDEEKEEEKPNIVHSA